MKRHGADHMEMTVRRMRMRAPGDAKWIWGWKLTFANLFFLEGGSAPQILIIPGIHAGGYPTRTTSMEDLGTRAKPRCHRPFGVIDADH